MLDFAIDAKSFLTSAGYSDSDLVSNYRFSRPFSADRFTHETADLIAFSGKPHTMRTACVGVINAESAAVAEKLHALRYLGVPVALVGDQETVSLYTLSANRPSELEKSTRPTWQEEFRTRLSDLSPEAIWAAKTGYRQLTFIDTSLGEWAEQISEQSVIRILGSLFQDSLNSIAKEHRKKTESTAEEAIIRLVCHLFACRVLEDKNVVPMSTSATTALKAAHERYPENFDLSVTRSPYFDNQLSTRIYDRLKNDFAFDSLNTDMLGRAYENALVTPKLRKEMGIYYTPRVITEYVLNGLPLESIPDENRYLCDPCCGSGSFLLAAFDRMSGLLPNRATTPAATHEYLRARIIGKDIDAFACEIARLSLILADPYNRDGWQVEPKNVKELTSKDFRKKPSIIVTNPKFKEEKKAGVRTEFSAEVLERLIAILAPGGLMGIVLPQSILDSSAGAAARKMVLTDCELLEISLLTGGLFYSAAEAAVIMLRKKDGTKSYSTPVVTTRELRSIDLANFKSRRTFTRTYPVNYSAWAKDKMARFIVSPLADVLDKISHQCQPLKTVATIHAGIQLKPSDKNSVIDAKNAVHNRPFVDRLDVLRPFASLASEGALPMRWLNYGPQLHRKRDQSIFEAEKVLINANRNPGSSWRLVAGIDRKGLYFSLNFHGIIPNDRSVSLEEIAAVLNSPIANAWFDANCRKRWVVQETLGRLPFPKFDSASAKLVRDTVRQMERTVVSMWRRNKEGLFYQGVVDGMDSYQLIREIDSAVYEAYGLTLAEQNKIDKIMNAEKRPA